MHEGPRLVAHMATLSTVQMSPRTVVCTVASGSGNIHLALWEFMPSLGARSSAKAARPPRALMTQPRRSATERREESRLNVLGE